MSAVREGTGVIRVLGRAMRVLECLRPDGPLSLAQIAQLTGMPKSTVHRIVATLEADGYLEQDAAGRYRSSMRLLLLAQRAVASSALLAAVRPAMRRVLAATGETVFCGTLSADSVVVLDVVTSTRPIHPLPGPGSRAPVHASSMGKVMLAYLPAEDRRRWLTGAPLARYTEHTIRDPRRLSGVLAAARLHGWAVNEQEEDLGVSCVAAPVRDRRGAVVAALSVAAPSARLAQAGVERFAGVVCEAAGRASRALGWTGGAEATAGRAVAEAAPLGP